MLYYTKPKTLADLYDYSTARFASNQMSSYTDGSRGYTYASFKKQCDNLSSLMSRMGIGAGDKVAIISENMPNWTVAMFAAVTAGRVMVPVLPDCSANEVNNILTHSGSKAVFASARQLEKISPENMEKLDLAVDISTLKPVKRKESTLALETPGKRPEPGDLAAILYTSGTSGQAKGVMLSHRNICHNLVAAPYVFRPTSRDIWLSILPMAHTYELAIGVLYPILLGARVCYMETAPTPSALIKALNQVRPTIICSVPLIIEKVYRKNVLVSIKKSKVLSWMNRRTPGLMYRLIGMKLKKTFGGRLKAFAIGGAKLDTEVEAFLKKAHFPYLIGYGMTETSPLICAATIKKTKVGSTGTPVKDVEVKILNPDPVTGMGEIVVKGPNVMMGYYKDPERTAEAFTPDGWLHTKDLASVDAKGNYTISGRLGNMILGASGENIYPEEIEMVINGIDSVEESLVKSDTSGHLIAMIKLVDNVRATEAMALHIIKRVNANVNKASQIARIEFVSEPFEKTATRKIRRFLYC